jgi:hypothetical protein
MCDPAQGIYLGFDHLRPFPDDRLYKLWTDYNSSSPVMYDEKAHNFTRYNTSVWQLGNDFINSGRWVMMAWSADCSVER